LRKKDLNDVEFEWEGMEKSVELQANIILKKRKDINNLEVN